MSLVVVELFSSSVSLRFVVFDSVGLIGLVFEHASADDVLFVRFVVIGHFISFLDEVDDGADNAYGHDGMDQGQEDVADGFDLIVSHVVHSTGFLGDVKGETR